MATPSGGPDRLVDELARQGIEDTRVLAAIREVPRTAFVPPELREYAFENRPLPIGLGQTISQPFIVALMAEAASLASSDRVLEIGTGSGYGAAVLSRLAGRVFTVERYAELAGQAAARLDRLGFDNVEIRIGDGTDGWPERAPFDAVLVTAAGPSVPETLFAQLADGGRLVMPVGQPGGEQRLIRRTRAAGGGYRESDLGRVAFVPLVGRHGFPG